MPAGFRVSGALYAAEMNPPTVERTGMTRFSPNRAEGHHQFSDTEAQFSDTERQYGGRAAYDQAKADGKTRLGYLQWVQVRTPAFKAWFGPWDTEPDKASKVVDPETGEPMVVYHGATSDFGEGGQAVAFDFGRTADEDLSSGKGAYLTTSPEAASKYAKGISWGNRGKSDAPNVMPVFANIRMPFDKGETYRLSDFENVLPESVVNNAKDEARPGDEFIEEAQQRIDDNQRKIEDLQGGYLNDEIADEYQIYEEDYEDRNEYEAAIEEAVEREVAILEQSIEDYEGQIARSWSDAEKYYANTRLTGAEIWDAIKEDLPEYTDWKNERQLIGGDTKGIEMDTEVARVLLEAFGFDGVKRTDKFPIETPHTVYIANTSPNQIKSATGNRGIFDANDPDIRHSVERSPSQTLHPLLVQVDGVDRPTRNSLGKPIHPTVEGIQNFWRWFGESKAVDAQGRPLVLYHGSPDLRFMKADAIFKSQRDRTGFGRTEAAHWFSADLRTAKSYSDPRRAFDYQGAEEGIIEAYIKIIDPLVVNAAGQEWQTAQRTGRTSDVIEDARAAGSDGVIIENVRDDYNNGRATRPTRTFTVFSSTQIKSATGNTGAFSPDNPDIRHSLNRATLGPLTPAQQDSVDRVLGSPKTFRERLADFRKDWAKNLKQGIFDQFAPIAELDPNAYIQARLSKGGDSSLEALMLYGKLFVGADGATDVRYTRVGGRQGFASKLAALKGEHDRFFLWVAAQRADRLKSIGLENLWSDTDITELGNLDQGQFNDGAPRAPAYDQALRDLNEFNDNVLEVAVSSGLIDEATRKLYENTPYIPFYRLQEDDQVSGFGISPGIVNQYAWKKLKGGTAKLNEDLLANLLQNWSHLITASAKNRAAKSTLDAAVKVGTAAQVPSGAPGKGHVSYKEAGKEKSFVVNDPHLMDAVAALHYAGLGPWAKPLSTAKHWLTVGVTVNPAFKLRNLIRDTISSLGTADLSYNVAGNLAHGWKATAADSETRAHMLAAGGMIRFGSMLDGQNSRRAQDLIRQGVAPDTILDSEAKITRFWKRYVSPAFEAYQELGDRGEQINRAALYEQLMKPKSKGGKGMTHGEAAFWARDLLDFSMSGKWTAIRTLTQTVPFFNARLQGLYKLGRAGKQDYRRLGTVLGATALASIALLLYFRDDDDWKKRSDSDRNNYWWFKVADTAFRAPKPFELGAMATVAEYGLDWMLNDEMTGARFGRNMRDLVMNQLSMNPVPQLFKPMMDVYANKDAFTGRAIESLADQRLRKQDRYDEKTSELARFLGSLGLPDLTQLATGEV
jgi:hypothetical protein